MDNLGGPIAFGGCGAGMRRINVSLSGGSGKTQSCSRLGLRGIALGGVLSLLRLFVPFLRVTAFLLFVPNRRVLTIAEYDPGVRV